MFKFTPLNNLDASIDLKAFGDIIDDVNAIDKVAISTPEKFSNAVDSALGNHRWGWRHLYQAFYFELPITLDREMTYYQHWRNFRYTSKLEGFMVVGMISGPLDLWRDFLLWGSHRDQSESLNQLSNATLSWFRRYSFFRS